MATNTTRLGLIKPAGLESRAVGPLNTNSDLNDKFMPCILVNDGVTPPTGDLYDGALVKERTSGIMWEARKNGGGTYDKVYVRYPCAFFASFVGSPIVAGSTTVHTTWGEWNTVTASACKNTSAANLISGRFVVPVKGIWHIKMCHIWAQNGSGQRAMCICHNGVNVTGEWEQIQVPTPSFQHKIVVSGTTIFSVSDTVCASGWQNSGGAVNLDNSFFRATLIEPIQ